MNSSQYSDAVSHGGYVQPPLGLDDIHFEAWREIKRILLEFRKNQAATAGQAEKIVQLMDAMHRELRQSASFLFALQQSNSAAGGEAAWSNAPLYQDDDMYLNLITYFSSRPTPIHDHPGMATVNFLLSGQLCIDYYYTGDSTLENTYPICKLRRTETHHYGAYEASMCFPWQKNLQEIRSISERSLILSAGLKTGYIQNSWYLPISPRNTDSFFTQRLKRND